ncbi:MAG TPA: hypothetical protein VGW36_03635, partial [Pyrinomonadaceae bacterium]|nr:hypothetical protein [Pyrinomonadaceae bacterium]
MSFFRKSEQKTLKPLAVAACLLLFGLAARTDAQSGRRARKPPPVDTVTPTVDPNAPTIPPPGSLENKVQLLIGRSPTRRHLQSEDAIFATFYERLSRFANVSATSLGDVKREAAVTRAKSETEAFVVLLTFSIDGFQGGTIILNSPDLEIEYEILAPRTGKKLTKGKIYFQTIGGGRMRRSEWPGGTPIKITPDA